MQREQGNLESVGAEIKEVKSYNFFKRSELSIIAACGADPDRPELHGVVLNFKDKLAIATEGHFMVRVPIKSPDALADLGDVLVPRGFFSYLESLGDVYFKSAEFDFTMKGVTVRTLISQASFSYLRRPIPDYRSISFEVENPVSVQINPTLLSRLRDAAGLDDHEGVILTISSSKDLAPIKVSSGSRLIGAIMPMRIGQHWEASQ